MRLFKDFIYTFLFSLIIAMGIFVNSARAEFTVPELTGPVVDNVGVMTSRDYQTLEKTFRKLNDRGIVQLQVLIVSSLEGESIEGASIKVIDKWKLGDATKDNGVLLFVSISDRKMRIEVGQGLEGALPDVYASRIIRDVMVPYFRKQLYSEGIVAGAYAIIQRVDSEFAESENIEVSKKKSGTSYLVIVFLIIIILLRFFSRLSMGVPFSRASGWGGSHRTGWDSGGGWSGGGGGWSGGGGGFSGGGASGGW